MFIKRRNGLVVGEKIDPKKPIENWRIEIVVDEEDVIGLLKNSVKGPGGFKNRLAFLGKALSNGYEHLECNTFVLLEDGSLIVRASDGLLPDNVLEIDLTEIANPGPLAVLDKELNARATRHGFHPWCLSGHIKGGSMPERLVMGDHGTFYLHNRRASWNALRTVVRAPLP